MGKPEELIANVVCFEGFALDASRRTLHRGAAEVRLRAKCFDLLSCLVSRAGVVVTKAELMETVWPNVVVTDESLTRCVSDIRQALGDAHQGIVKTVPRRGYVLAAPVSFAATASANPIDSPAVLNDGAQRVLPAATASDASPHGWRMQPQSRRARGVSATMAALLVAGLAWMPLRDSSSERRAELLPRAASPVDAKRRLSIAVLPLANRDDNADQARFAEGLADDLTTAASRIPGSFVAARSSVDAYRRASRDVRQVGRELGVRYVLEGSVQRLADQARLHLRLIDTDSGAALWAERIDGSAHSLDDLRSRVAGTVTRTLFLEMMSAEAERSRIARPDRPTAKDLIWQGFSALQRASAETNAASRGLLLRALQIERDSASAWAGLAHTHASDVANRWVSGTARDESLWSAEQAAKKAYALDPEDQAAIGALGKVLLLRGHPEQALWLVQRLVTLNPSLAPAWLSISLAYADLGKPDESIGASQEALRLSPHDGRRHQFFATLAQAHLYAGRDAEALNWAKQSVVARPDDGIAHAWMAAAAANLGDMATARAALAEFQRLRPGDTLASFKEEQHGDNADFLRQRGRFYKGLRKAGLA